MSAIEQRNEDFGIKDARPQTLNRKLPLSRVKKIVKMDEDVVAVSNAAAQIISASTERFAAYFAEQSFFFTLAEKKKGLSYKHCASAVARLPQLDFLADVVPPISKNTQAASLQSKKNTSKSKQGAQDNDSEIPDWARAHPEALAKIQAAQAAHALLEQQSNEVTAQASDEHEQPASEGPELITTEPQVETTDTDKENPMQQDTPTDPDDLHVQQSLLHRQLNSTAPVESISPDEIMDEA